MLQISDKMDIGGHYNGTLEQGQCFVLMVLTLPRTAPEGTSSVGHSRAAIGQSKGSAHWPPTVLSTTWAVNRPLSDIN